MYKRCSMLVCVALAVGVTACSRGEDSVPPSIRVAPSDGVPVTVAVSTSQVPPSTVEAAANATGARTPSGGLSGSVVRIVTTGTYVPPDIGALTTEAGSGSGFVVDPSGLVVTNNHVVAGAAIVEAYFDGDPTPIPATVVATSECSDLAVIDLSGDGYTPIEWSDRPVETGTSVRAAGFPDGDPQFALTEGIVSRVSVNGDTPWAAIGSMVQHDADVRPGNSGGPLVDDEGRVVGVNTAASEKGRFAVPAAVAEPIVARLARGEDVDSVGLNALAVHDESTNDAGVWIQSVRPGSPGEAVGLQPGDLITRMNGLRVGLDGTLADYCGVIRTAGSGQIPVEVQRGGATLGGSINGDVLQPVLGAVDDATAEAASPPQAVAAPEAGTPYSDFVRIQDDTGSLAIDIPAAWSDHDTRQSMIAGQLRPSISAAPDMVATTAAIGDSSFTQPGVDATLFFVGASMEDTLAVLNDNSPWWDCPSSQSTSFEDSVYRGAITIFAGCGGSHAVVTMAVERIGTDRWMLLNVYAATLADIDAATRIVKTFDFLDTEATPPTQSTTPPDPASSAAAPSTPSTDQPTRSTAHDADVSTSGPASAGSASVSETDVSKVPVLPSTLSADVAAVVGVVGAPTADAIVDEVSPSDVGGSVIYTYTGGLDVVESWTNAVAARIGCIDPLFSKHPPDAGDDQAWMALSCDVSTRGQTFALSVRTWVLGDATETVVQVTRLAA